MGQRLLEQRAILEDVADAGLEFLSLRTAATAT